MMKSVGARITLILLLGFILIALPTKLLIEKSVILQINSKELKRQRVLQQVVTKLEKNPYDFENASRILDAHSAKSSIKFTLETMDKSIIYKSKGNLNISNSIHEMDTVKQKKKPAYIIHAYFPPEFGMGTKGETAVIFALSSVILLVSAIVSFLIYRVLSNPITKLRKALDSINYGNTIVDIPYKENDSIGLLCRNVEDMGRRLKYSEDSQNELIQAISHDLKTPLTSILGYVERLNNGRVKDEEKKFEYYSTIYRKASDLKELIYELDDYSSISSTKKYNLIEINCRSFIDDMLKDLETEITQHGGSLKRSIEVDANTTFLIDASRLKRVFTNIIQNSFKYAGEKCTITVSSTLESKSILFEICDDGPGVPEDKLLRIFNRFYRLDTSRSREKGGMGLGLSICKSIVEAHEGKIYAKSNPTGGLCICFALPTNNLNVV